MYSLLITAVLDEDMRYGRPWAIDHQLCRKLAVERDFPRVVSHLEFHLSQNCLQLDYLDIQNAPGQLCSQRFIEVLRGAHVPFITYPARLIDRDTKQPFTASYSFWIPQWLEEAIDWERSEQWVNLETGARWLTKLVLTTECEAAAPLLFQTRERGYYLIHDMLQIQLETIGIKGVTFAPLDAAYMPHEGVKKLELERLLKEHPEDWTRWCKLSDSQMVLHRYQDALNSLSQALALKPDLEEAWYRRGSILYTLGHFQEALDALKRAIELEPRSLAWNEYCAVLRKLGRHEEALASAGHAVGIWSKSSASWYELAAAHVALGHYEAALQAIERGLALGGGGGTRLAEMYRIKGEALSRLGQYEEALSAYTVGVSCSPLVRALWAAKASVLQILGRHEEASMAQQELDRLEQQREKNLLKRPT